MDKKTETVISELKYGVMKKCQERIDCAKKKRKNGEQIPEEHGLTSIMKNKYLLIVISMAIGLSCISMPAFADEDNTIIIEQNIIDLVGGGSKPPVAYLGEYVDLSKVVGWSGQVGYWYGDPSNVKNPDIIIDASTFQHRFWIDPSKFKVGMWYKWDGAYEDASNNEAFEVKSGTRPAAVPTEVNANNTFITPIVTAVPYQPSEVHILMARGDQVEYNYWSSDTRKYGALWLFGKEQSILGYRMDSPQGGDNLFKFPFLEEITLALEPGWYTGYLQFYAKRPDVFYNKTRNVLDTPYDNSIIPDVNIAGLTPDRVKAEFERLESNAAYSEDKLVNITMEVKDPIIQFTDYYEVGDSIIVQGKSTLSVGTNVSFIIDPTRYVAGYSTSSHTVTVPLTGTIKEPREFSVTIPVDWTQMAIGRHTVVATVDKLKTHLVQTKEFDITSIWVEPTPTRISEKVIVESGGWHRINATVEEVVTQRTPEVIYVNSTPQIIYVTVYQTLPPTPIPQTPEPTPIPTTEESPISSVITLGALVAIGYIVINRK